ncbi:MAG: four helix bundle protein [Gemmatimonadaceae bacterium]|nr:four helix bundle protein [Gemmatimonadaceae bacterium]
MADHRKLRVWQQAQDFVVHLADALLPSITARLPGLRNQLLRAAASIPAAIAEGAAQQSMAQYARYLSIALGSASETESHLTLAVRLHVVRDGDERLMELEHIRKMLYRLREAVVRGANEPRGGSGGQPPLRSSSSSRKAPPTP